jgi:hypothetical protein
MTYTPVDFEELNRLVEEARKWQLLKPKYQELAKRLNDTAKELDRIADLLYPNINVVVKTQHKTLKYDSMVTELFDSIMGGQTVTSKYIETRFPDLELNHYVYLKDKLNHTKGIEKIKHGRTVAWIAAGGTK